MSPSPPSLWPRIHRRPFFFDRYDPAIELRWLGQIGRRLPGNCACRLEWANYLKACPPATNSTDDYFAWGVEAHNHVNRRIAKPVVSLADADQLWRPAPLSPFTGQFDRVIYINLDRRTDRRRAFEAHITELRAAGDWPFPIPQRFAAIDGPASRRDAVWGCLQSHRQAFSGAIDSGAQSILVFEDDCIFSDHFSSRFATFLSSVPPDWDGLWLGHQEATWIEDDAGRSIGVPGAPGVRRSRWPHRLHAYALRGLAMHAVLDAWETGVGHADHLIGPLLGSGRFCVYIPDPPLAGQAAGRSDLMNQNVAEQWWGNAIATATHDNTPNAPDPDARLPLPKRILRSFEPAPRPGPLPYIGDRIVLLRSTRQVRERLRAQGLHSGYDLALDGNDRYLNRLFSEATDHTARVSRLISWLSVIQNEAAMRGRTPCVWLSTFGEPEARAIAEASAKSACHGSKPPTELAVNSVDEAHASLAPLAVPRRAGARVFAVMSLRNGPTDLLPHWLKHYHQLGADSLLIGVYSDLMGRAEEVHSQCQGYPVTLTTYSMDDWTDASQNDHHRAMLRLAGASPMDWVLWTDLDEFAELPAPLPEVLRACDKKRIDAFKGYFVDRVAADGRLTDLAPEPSIFEQYPVGCQITKNLMGGWTQKVMLARYRVYVSTGHHTADVPLRRMPIGKMSQYRVHHFKWRAGLIERLDWALAHASDHIQGWASEARKFKDWYVANGNRIDVDDKRIY